MSQYKLFSENDSFPVIVFIHTDSGTLFTCIFLCPTFISYALSHYQSAHSLIVCLFLFHRIYSMRAIQTFCVHLLFRCLLLSCSIVLFGLTTTKLTTTTTTTTPTISHFECRSYCAQLTVGPKYLPLVVSTAVINVAVAGRLSKDNCR